MFRYENDVIFIYFLTKFVLVLFVCFLPTMRRLVSSIPTLFTHFLFFFLLLDIIF